MGRKKVIVIGLLLIFLTNFILNSEGQKVIINTNSYEPSFINTKNVKVLVLMDHDFGANCDGILEKLNRFGWNVTVAGPEKTIIGCDFTGNVEFEVDILYSEIGSVTQYDCINIMPGETHENLLANQNNILNAIKSANTNQVKISAWCKAVLVLAEADVIDGHDVTGDAIYQDEYEAAGATFHELVLPIIDGNIITGVRSNYWQTEMCIAIATAIGCYEQDAPSIGVPVITDFPNSSMLIEINITDISGVYSAKLELTLLSTPEDPSTPSTLEIFLQNLHDDGIYDCTINKLYFAIYEVAVVVEDIFWNTMTYEDIIDITVRPEASINYLLPILLFTLLFNIRKRRK